MKQVLVATATVLFSFTVGTTAWADTTKTVESGAESLTTQAVELTEPSENESDRLNGLANRINQRMNGNSSRSENQPSINEFLNLPQDMVVRGTRRGGVAIGTEF